MFHDLVNMWLNNNEWKKHSVSFEGEYLGPDDDQAEKVVRVVCMTSTDSEGNVMPIEATLHSFPKSHACQAFFRLPAGMRVEEAKAYSASGQEITVDVNSIEPYGHPYGSDVWTLWMDFAKGKVPKVSRIKLALRLEADSEAEAKATA